MVTNWVFSVGFVKVGWLLVPAELLFGVNFCLNPALHHLNQQKGPGITGYQNCQGCLQLPFL